MVSSYAHLTVGESGPAQSDIDDEIHWLGRRREPATPELWDEMAEALVTSVGLLKDGTPFSLGLSGGRDSRLVAAALSYHDVPYVAGSSGYADSADVILGQRISELLGAPKRLTLRSVTYSGDVDFHAGTSRYIRHCDGMSMTRSILSSTFHVEEPVPIPAGDRVPIDGVAGEILRGGGYIVPSRSYMQGRTSLTEKEVREILGQTMTSVAQDWIVPELRNRYRDRMADWTASTLDPACPTNALERLYFEHAFQVKYGFHDWIMPLGDNRLIRLANRTSPDVRILERHPFETIRRIHEPLLRIPLENSRWAFEAERPLPGDEDGWRAREPVMDRSVAYNYAYFMAGREALDEIRSVIFDSPGSAALAAIADFDAIERSIARGDLHDYRYGWSVWNFYSAAILLSGINFRDDVPDRPPIFVDVRAPYNMMSADLLKLLNLSAPQTDSHGRMRALWQHSLADASLSVRDIKQRFMRRAVGGATLLALFARRSSAAAWSALFRGDEERFPLKPILRKLASDLDRIRTVHKVDDDAWKAFLEPIDLTGFAKKQDTDIATAHDLWRHRDEFDGVGGVVALRNGSVAAQDLMRQMKAGLNVK